MTDLEDRFEFGDQTKESLVEAARSADTTVYSGGYAARPRRTTDDILVYRVVEVRDL